MSNRVIVRCAPSGIGRGPNYGMQTVDFAIYNICKSIKGGDKVALQSPWPAYAENGTWNGLAERDSFPRSFNYGFDSIDPLSVDDLILFWGDFQWGADYQYQSQLRLKKIHPGMFSDEEVRNLIEDYFLLKSAFRKDVLSSKVCSYGSTLFQNRFLDYLNDEYFRNLRWLITNSIFVRFRDAFSASFCAEVRNEFQQSFLGVDSALLSTKDELLSFPLGDDEFVSAFSGQIGYYFGRSSKAFPKYYVTKFAKELCKQLGKKLVKIPWTYFADGLFTESMDNFFKVFRVPQISLPYKSFLSGDILKGMAKCAFIITDTYHVAINAIALGVPVAMVPEFRTANTRDANMGFVESWRDKRVLFFQSNSLSDLMILPDLLSRKSYRQKKIDIMQRMLVKSDFRILYEPIVNRARFDRKLLEELLAKHIE